ncbi:MAG TPA: LuxR C-terminal-related transcriptional regulator, partial [Actinoplanes sp.]|nr:LuxR C-terminal-related transcriptional regulator [Actinoplanes sp.]
AARHLTPLVAAAEAGLLSVGECVEAGRQLLWHGRDDEAATVLDQICASDDHEARAFELWLACTHPRLVRRGQRPAVRRQPRAVARIPAWQRFSVALADILHGQHGPGLTLWEQLLGESHVHKDSRWSPDSPLESLMPGVYAGALTTATTWCRLWSRDRTAGPPVRQAQLAAVAAEIAVRRDDFTAAVDHARTAVETLSVPGWGAAVGLPLGALVLAATRMGDLDTAAEQLRRPVPRAMFDSRYGVHYLYARGTYQLARDNVHAALSDFLTCGDLMRQWSLDTSGLVPWRVGAAQALLRQSAPDQARKLLTEQLARAGTDTDAGPVRGAALRLLAACSPQNQRVELLTAAVDTIESGGSRYELALALADLSHAQEYSGEYRTARLTARRAWHVAKSCHAEPICQALAPKRAHTDPPVPTPASGPAVLSPAERRVATLASDGHSNRVIASKLLITESTVEQHLTKVYRKLNVKHRGNLPASFPG